MKKLNCTPADITGIGDEEEVENSWLNDSFINPLKELGFEFEGYGHVYDKDDEQGTHILKFKEKGLNGLNIGEESRRGDYEAMCQICSQDDDSQPSATHRLYLDTLWVYIPYNT